MVKYINLPSKQDGHICCDTGPYSLLWLKGNRSWDLCGVEFGIKWKLLTWYFVGVCSSTAHMCWVLSEKCQHMVRGWISFRSFNRIFLGHHCVSSIITLVGWGKVEVPKFKTGLVSTGMHGNCSRKLHGTALSSELKMCLYSKRTCKAICNSIIHNVMN